MKSKTSLAIFLAAMLQIGAFAEPAASSGNMPWMTSGTVYLSTNALVAGDECVSTSVNASNKLIVAYWTRMAGVGAIADAMRLVVEVSPDGSTWYRNPNLSLSVTNFPAITNHYVSAAIDGAPWTRLRVIAGTNLTAITTNVTWTTKE